MRWGVALALAACALTGAARPTPQSTPTPPVMWSPDDPMDGGNDLKIPLPVRIVPRGETVRGLPIAARQIAPVYTWQGRTWTVDDYMRAYNVSGVLVLKDGKVILERYAMGRSPTDRWVSQSVRSR